MDLKALPTPVLLHIAKLLEISLQSLVATIALFDEGGTVPFIARYRKEATGNLDEVKILSIQEKLEYFRELEDRRATVLASIAEQGKLTPELQAKIEKTLDKSELEDLYLPYKPKRKTKASVAREKGFEPLALYLWEQIPNGQPLAAFAATFGDPQEALEGARHIISEMVAENADFRKAVRAMMAEKGIVVSKAIEGVPDPEGKFKMYADFSEPVSKIPSHRMLAIRRGAKEGILHFEIELNRDEVCAWLRSKVCREPGEWQPHLHEAIEDGYDRLLNPSIQTEIRLDLKDRSDEEAIKVFRENLENLLLSPPAGALTVIGVDPGIRTGCKIAVVDDTGKLLEHTVIYPLEPKNDVAGSIRTLSRLIQQHNAQAFAIGNGTGSREVADIIKQANLGPFSVVVSE
ncbi:MAG: RNA-binding transcriptional accessory protein, partial [Acidobacteriia bacterium 12-62-4]